MTSAPSVEKESKKKTTKQTSLTTAWKRRSNPTLRFSPFAWAKLLFLRDLGPTEVGGFGITSAEDLLLVEDVVLVRQQCTVATVHFEDESVADFFDDQVDRGRQPQQVGRIWLHTHPGDSAEPSGVDEETFARVFGNADWAVMGILAQAGPTYARLRFNVGPGGQVLIPVEQDYSTVFPATDRAAWEQEYAENVEIPPGGWPAAIWPAAGDEPWEFEDWDPFDEEATMVAEEEGGGEDP